jgi:Na+:H+ antiporter
MTDTTTFFVDLFILLTAAVVAGEVANRLGQVALVGQLLVGVVLGPTLLGPFIGLGTLTPQLSAIQFLGTVFILFMAGLDIVPEQIVRMGPATVAMGIAVFAVPFGILTVVAALFVGTSDLLLPLFLGLTLSITALPVMGIMLYEFGLIRTRIGNLLINTALINEITAVSIFAVLLQLRFGAYGGAIAIAVAVTSVGLFISVVLTVHMVLRTLGRTGWWEGTRGRFAASLRTKEAGFAILMIGVLGASLFSQFLGLPFLVGAFYAGILVTRETAGREAHRAISGIFDAMTWGFFLPLFFAFAGLEMNLGLLARPIDLLAFGALVVAAVLSKVGTGYTIARFFRWPRVDALAIGHLVSSRGAVELAMAVILLGDGVFSTRSFTLVAGVGLVTTLIAPLAAGRVWRTAAAGESMVQHRLAGLKAERAATPLPLSQGLGFRLIEEYGLGSAESSVVTPEATAPAEPAAPPAAPAAPPARGPPPLPKERR